ncbi:MAG: O-antigen ligase family protein [Rhodobacteraceae bacterium]|nr:O-antigen ligase family protein [Paracoccaceae bacterium]
MDRYSGIIALMLFGVLALSPLPQGSNGPIYWLLSAMVVFFAAAVFFAGKARGEGKAFWPEGLGLLAGVFLAFSLVQIWVGGSAAPRSSALALLRVSGYGVFYFLMVRVVAGHWPVVGWVFGLVVVYAFLGLVMRLGGADMAALFGPDAYPGSASGPFVNRNSFATYLGFGLIAGLALPARPAYLAGLGLVFAVLLMTNSRMGVMAVVIAVFWLASRRYPRRGAWALVVLAVLWFLLFGAGLSGRLDTLGQDIDTRLLLYAQVLDMIKTRPWTGFGLDTFSAAFQGFHRSGVSVDLLWDKPHNSYLGNWVASGVVIGSLPVVMGLWLLVRFVRKKNHLGEAVLVLGGLHSMVDFSLEIQANMYVFLTLLAVASAKSCGQSHEEKGRKTGKWLEPGYG